MPELVALDLEQDQQLPKIIESIWSRGDAICVLDPRWGTDLSERALRALSPTRIITKDGERRLPGGTGTEAGDAIVALTSGSTADPKAAILTHDAVKASALLTSQALNAGPSSHWLCCLPTTHIGGLSVIARALIVGSALSVIDRPDTAFINAGPSRGITHVSLVATVLRRCTTRDYERVLLGGAAAPEEVAPNVVNTYGMTETGSGVVYDGWPLEEVAIAIRDEDEQGFGEILIASPTSLRAYRDGSDPFVTGPPSELPWIATGDLGRISDDGSLAVRGRIADVIMTGGEKVYPLDVERIIEGLDSVAHVAVWKRPDPQWGERVVAWVVPNGQGPSLEDLKHAVRSTLADYAAPKELVIVASLPRTDLGKVSRRSLS